MMEVAKLKAAPDRNNQQVMEMLEDMLKQAKSGELIAVTGIMEYRCGSYGQFGSSTMSRLQTSGALLEAAVKRLGFQG